MSDKTPKKLEHVLRRAAWVGATWCKEGDIVALTPAQAKYVPADPVAPAAKSAPKPARTGGKPAAAEADKA